MAQLARNICSSRNDQLINLMAQSDVVVVVVVDGQRLTLNGHR